MTGHYLTLSWIPTRRAPPRYPQVSMNLRSSLRISQNLCLSSGDVHRGDARAARPGLGPSRLQYPRARLQGLKLL